MTRSRHTLSRSPNRRMRDQVGAVSAEYAAVTAAGCGLAGVLIKLLTSDFGQRMLTRLFDFFLSMIGIG